MEYFIFGSIIFILIFLLFQHLNKRKSKSDIEKIRIEWGKPKSRTSEFHIASIKKYANAITENFHRLTDQTIEDIDFHRVFMFIDRTTSRVGQQFLYKKVIEPTNEVKDPSENFIELFTRDQNLREEIQVELLKLSDYDAYYISSLLKGGFLPKPKWFNLVILNVSIISCLIILSFKFIGLIIVLILPITINMFIHFYNKQITIQFTRSVPQLNLLITVSQELMKKGGLFHDKAVAESIANLKSFKQSARWVRFRPGGFTTDLSQYLFDIIKIIFLIEFFMIFKVMKELKDKRASIITLFNYVGKVDASISIASLRAGKLKTCRPAFIPLKKEMVAKNVYHPLIKDCVKNSFAINNKSILITGSNMSGKSTFLRTLTINSILAQTIYTCFADEYSTPIVKQFSSIRIDDNLFEGKSYYFQEVNTIGSLITEAQQPNQNLFILDEVFKGTNTVERISAAKAILSYLNRDNNIVIVSTHDIELADMLKGEYDLYHFTETIENHELHFDHKIKSGQVKTRNAIKLLELSNYPAEIISEARQISATLGHTRIVGKD
jgi:DNA mismatch repair ATPase MutS